MPQNYFVVKDTVTGLFLTYYSTLLENCLFGNVGDAIHYNEEDATTTANDLNQQANADRFIGQNPPPR